MMNSLLERKSKLISSAVQPNANCSICHQASAATDQVFTQYYPVLRSAKGNGKASIGGKKRTGTAVESNSKISDLTAH